MTEQSISATKGKQCCVHEDPYARGEWSDKCAKPNTLSTTANVHAHVSASTVVPAIVPASTSQPITTYAHASTSIVVPALSSMPTSQPITTHTHTSTVVPALLPAPTSQSITAKAHALLRPSSRHNRSRILVSKDICVRVSHISVNPACRVSKQTKSWHLA